MIDLTSKFKRGIRLLFRDPKAFILRLFPSLIRISIWKSNRSKTAADLNRRLYADVDTISKPEYSNSLKHTLDFCKSRGFTPEYTDSNLTHVYRFAITIKWLQDIIDSNFSGPIVCLETGGEDIMSDFLRLHFGHLDWRLTNGDLRYNWGTPPNSADLIVCTEILEHISDIPEGYQVSFLETGIQRMLSLAYDVLKEGGIFFITTPNAASVIQLSKILFGNSPWFYKLHVREYTLDEIRGHLVEAGFTILKAKSVHCLSATNRTDYTPLFDMLLHNNFVVDNRGDDLFIVAQKTSSKQTQ